MSNLITVFLDVPALAIDTPLSPLNAASLAYEVAGGGTGLHTDGILAGWAGIQPWPGTAPVPSTPFPTITNLGSTVSASSVSAGLGQANTVGALSVPPTWTVATPAVRTVALALPATSATATGLGVGSGSTFSDMALASMAGRAMAGTLGSGGGRDRSKVARGERVTSTGEPMASNTDGAAAADEAAAQNSPRTVVTAVAAEIRELAKLRDEGILTDEEFTERKKRLLGQ